ncbi:MAG: PIN domain-containing protein [Desulfobacterales bacterium]|nr:PIN domain-containing protein [Desulfobacterales bacterium]
MKRIYLNNSTLNRPFDDQSQARIKLETEALFQILSDIDLRNSKLILSEVTELENSKNPYYSVKIRIDELISKADKKVKVNANTRRQAKLFENAGLNGMDALHLAAAIQGKIDFFITCDDSFLKKAKKATSDQTIKIMNPIEYVLAEGL